MTPGKRGRGPRRHESLEWVCEGPAHGAIRLDLGQRSLQSENGRMVNMLGGPQGLHCSYSALPLELESAIDNKSSNRCAVCQSNFIYNRL